MVIHIYIYGGPHIHIHTQVMIHIYIYGYSRELLQIHIYIYGYPYMIHIYIYGYSREFLQPICVMASEFLQVGLIYACINNHTHKRLSTYTYVATFLTNHNSEFARDAFEV